MRRFEEVIYKNTISSGVINIYFNESMFHIAVITAVIFQVDTGEERHRGEYGYFQGWIYSEIGI